MTARTAFKDIKKFFDGINTAGLNYLPTPVSWKENEYQLVYSLNF